MIEFENAFGPALIAVLAAALLVALYRVAFPQSADEAARKSRKRQGRKALKRHRTMQANWNHGMKSLSRRPSVQFEWPFNRVGKRRGR